MNWLTLFQQTTAVDVFNAVLALGGVLVGFGAMHKMDKKTERPIILAFTTVCVGLLGQIPASLTHSYWQPVCDTLLFGGAASLMVGTRKRTIWLSPKWMPWVSLGISVAAWTVFFCRIEL